MVKVRKDRVQAYLNGTLITQWKTNYSDMSCDGPSRHSNTIGLGMWQSPTVFYSAEVVEITGKGKLLK
jgi:hypothetical protein